MNIELLQEKWQHYKEEFFKEPPLYDEKYKWDVLKQVAEKWDWTASDKSKMLKESFEVKGSNNLWTSINYFPISMAIWFINDFPDETIGAFDNLFDEQIELLIRLNNFKTYFDEKLKLLQVKYTDKKLNYHSQDIRSISLYLFINNPSKYALFKFSFVKNFAQHLGFGSLKKGQNENYLLYLDILQRIKKIISDDPFITQYHQYNIEKNTYADESLHLLIQDFMYCTATYSDDKLVKSWLYAPGEGAHRWEEFYNEKIMALGWDDLSDLNNYSDKNAIREGIINTYGGKGSKKNDVTANDDFINKIDAGDVIIVKKGIYELLGYGIVESEYYFDESRGDYKHCRKVNWVKKGKWPSNLTLVQKTLTDITGYSSPIDNKQSYSDYLLNIMNTVFYSDRNKIKLLNYKKQIILQGPPGTGKTRDAKLIAKEMIPLTRELIKSKITVGKLIPTAKGQVSYKIVDVRSDEIILEREKGTLKKITFTQVISAFNAHKWNDEITNNNDRMAVALAKYLYDDFFTDNEQFKLIQFHPSYTYEDFVRGIIAESKGDKIEYRNVNKSIGEFAELALKNFKSSQEIGINNNLDSWIDTNFDLFKEDIIAQLPENEIPLSGDITIYDVTDNSFKYGKNWKTASHILFGEFKSLIRTIIKKDLDLSNRQMDKESFRHAHYRYTYYNALLEKFFQDFKYEYNGDVISEKNYILVIDEINRANLSSVLGELIYALEYRNEIVHSPYGIKDQNDKIRTELVLPPNLYIIGTMNTADRSVGHIDYAIRRRFAFVDVLPEKLEDTKDIFFNTPDFIEVTKLFIKVEEDEVINFENAEDSDLLSNDFSSKDVALGHSYFIADKKKISEEEKDNYFKMKMKYEVVPILNEYLKDGVFNESATIKIKDIEQRFI